MPVYSGDKWYRYGRGRVMQFYATDEELYEFLVQQLPKEFGPYTFLWKCSIPEGKKYRHEYHEDDLNRFLEIRMQDVWDFFVLSKLLTRDSFRETLVPLDWSWSLSGLINIHQGRKSKHGREFSSIGIVHKIENKQTGEIVTHDDYLTIFNKLKRALRKQLRYTTKKKRQNGTIEESKTILMTEGYAEFCRAHPEESSVMIGEPQK